MHRNHHRRLVAQKSRSNDLPQLTLLFYHTHTHTHIQTHARAVVDSPFLVLPRNPPPWSSIPFSSRPPSSEPLPSSSLPPSASPWLRVCLWPCCTLPRSTSCRPLSGTGTAMMPLTSRHDSFRWWRPVCSQYGSVEEGEEGRRGKRGQKGRGDDNADE